MGLPTKNQPIKAKSQTQAPAPKPAAAQQNAAGARINRTPAPALIKEAPVQFPLARRNFIFMIAAGLLIVIGFILMLGPGSTPEKFNPDIFSTRASSSARHLPSSVSYSWALLSSSSRLKNPTPSVALTRIPTTHRHNTADRLHITTVRFSTTTEIINSNNN